MEKIASYPYGSEISVERKHNKPVYGELIVADWRRLIVYQYRTDSCVEIPRYDVDDYILYFAKPRNYGATIPFSLLVVAAHGYYAVFTLPFNLITSIAITAGAYSSVRYTREQMPYTSLHMFARFPQGLPSGLDLRNIRSSP